MYLLKSMNAFKAQTHALKVALGTAPPTDRCHQIMSYWDSVRSSVAAARNDGMLAASATTEGPMGISRWVWGFEKWVPTGTYPPIPKEVFTHSISNPVVIGDNWPRAAEIAREENDQTQQPATPPNRGLECHKNFRRCIVDNGYTTTGGKKILGWFDLRYSVAALAEISLAEAKCEPYAGISDSLRREKLKNSLEKILKEHRSLIKKCVPCKS